MCAKLCAAEGPTAIVDAHSRFQLSPFDMQYKSRAAQQVRQERVLWSIVFCLEVHARPVSPTVTHRWRLQSPFDVPLHWRSSPFSQNGAFTGGARNHEGLKGADRKTFVILLPSPQRPFCDPLASTCDASPLVTRLIPRRARTVSWNRCRITSTKAPSRAPWLTGGLHRPRPRGRQACSEQHRFHTTRPALAAVRVHAKRLVDDGQGQPLSAPGGRR
jgi:hypothetical protein